MDQKAESKFAGGDTSSVTVERVLSTQLANAVRLRDGPCRVCASIIFITSASDYKQAWTTGTSKRSIGF